MLTELKARFEATDMTGQARLVPGNGNRAVMEFRWSEPPSDEVNEANIVVTMDGGRIAAMRDYGRKRAAHRAAGIPPPSASSTR